MICFFKQVKVTCDETNRKRNKGDWGQKMQFYAWVGHLKMNGTDGTKEKHPS